MTKRKAIILDCDDILLDYIQGIKKFAEKHYDIKTTGLPNEYDLSSWFGTTRDVTYSIMEHFNYQSYEFGLLEPIQGAVPYVQWLIKKYGDSTDFIIVTKSGFEGHAKVLREVNLHNVFGDVFTSIIMIAPSESKRPVLKKLMKSYDVRAFVDDNIDNVKVGIDLGINTLMLWRSHNDSFKYDQCYTTWSDMSEQIDKLLK